MLLNWGQNVTQPCQDGKKKDSVLHADILLVLISWWVFFKEIWMIKGWFILILPFCSCSRSWRPLQVFAVRYGCMIVSGDNTESLLRFLFSHLQRLSHPVHLLFTSFRCFITAPKHSWWMHVRCLPAVLSVVVIISESRDDVVELWVDISESHPVHTLNRSLGYIEFCCS